MITVYKFPLGMGTTHVNLPAAHEILHVDSDVGIPDMLCVWVRLDDAEPYVTTRSFIVTGTGMTAPHPGAAVHVGSVRNPPYIWHVFADKRL